MCRLVAAVILHASCRDNQTITEVCNGATRKVAFVKRKCRWHPPNDLYTPMPHGANDRFSANTDNTEFAPDQYWRSLPE